MKELNLYLKWEWSDITAETRVVVYKEGSQFCLASFPEEFDLRAWQNRMINHYAKQNITLIFHSKQF